MVEPEYNQDDGLHIIEHGGEKPTVDIIAVHGLAANPVYTWIKKVPDEEVAENASAKLGRLNSKEEREVMWLKHLLPTVVPHARILKFNYDSKYLVNAPRESLRSLGERLANTIRNLRAKEENTTNRPIIFIGHSFGGIVIQEAIVFAQSSGGDYGGIVSSISGIVFLGTPFRGSPASTWGAVITRCASALGFGSHATLLKTLEDHSERLDILLSHFLVITKQFDIRLVCFYETKPTWLGLGYYPLGTSTIVVDQRSATIDGYESNSLPLDHSALNKYSSTSDSGFVLISSKLMDLVQWSQAREPKLTSAAAMTPQYDIPFCPPEVRRNANFVGREDLLEQLKKNIGVGSAGADMHMVEVVLHGTGGMGKTQLALQYVFRHNEDYSSVFWVNAASEQSLKLGFTNIMQQLIQYHAQSSDKPDYTAIGRLLGISGKLDGAGKFTVQQPAEEQHVICAVKQWFAAKANTKWLLVIDNLDDLESFDLSDYIPQCCHGTVIITSRRPDCVRRRRGVEVLQMQDSEAEELLVQSANRKFENLAPDERQAAASIAQGLGYLPLALDQAGAYIHMQQYSFIRYLREYRTNISYLLSGKWTVVGKQDESVFATLELSFNAIQKQNPRAAELLLLCGFMDNEDIPEELLRRGMGLSADDASLDDSLRILFSYSMAKRKQRDDSFNIHPLVHMWARTRLKPEEQQKKATEAFIIVSTAVTTDTIRVLQDWDFERRIMAHIVAVEGHMKPVEIVDERLLKGGYMLGYVYSTHGQYSMALEWYVRVLAGKEKVLGVDHLSTLTIVQKIASVFDDQGRYGKALEWYGRVLSGREEVLGVGHPDTLTTVHDMALIFSKQGKYGKALQWYGRVLVGREKALGVDHPSTLTTVHNMALIFGQQGQHGKALDWYGRVLAGDEKVLGVDHPDTLTTVHNMALIFNNQGQYGKALEWYGRALVGYEKTLGVDHPSTLRTVHCMASIFETQGQYRKALEWYERALAGKEKVLGADHPSTLTTVYDMASIFGKQGQYSKALEWYQRVLAGEEKALGVDHPDTLTTLHNMAFILTEQGQYGKALDWYERVLAGEEEALGIDHPSTQDTIYSLVTLYEIMEQQEQAQELRMKLHLPLPSSPILVTTPSTTLAVDITTIETLEALEARGIIVGEKVARPRAEMGMERVSDEEVVSKRRKLGGELF